MARGVAGIYAIVDTEGFTTKADVKGHRGAVDAARMMLMLIGDVEVSSRGRHPRRPVEAAVVKATVPSR
jgi:hypothetical protein